MSYEKKPKLYALYKILYRHRGKFPNQGPTPQRRNILGCIKAWWSVRNFSLATWSSWKFTGSLCCWQNKTGDNSLWLKDFIIEAETEWAMCMFRTVIARVVITEVHLSVTQTFKTTERHLIWDRDDKMDLLVFSTLPGIQKGWWRLCSGIKSCIPLEFTQSLVEKKVPVWTHSFHFLKVTFSPHQQWRKQYKRCHARYLLCLLITFPSSFISSDCLNVKQLVQQHYLRNMATLTIYLTIINMSLPSEPGIILLNLRAKLTAVENDMLQR